MRSRNLTAAAAASAVVLVASLSGCAGSSSDDVVELEYWTWVSATKDIVEQWNDENPSIQVKVVEAAGAADMSAKLVAAERAGEAPDLAQTEYQRLPNVVASGAALDISSYVDDFKDAFTPEIWGLTTLGGHVYGVPSDIGPMLMMYRSDIFDELGLSVPTTWAEYAEVAAKVRELNPDMYLGGYPDDASIFTGYVQQHGGTWWDTDGSSWTVSVDDAASRDVAEYWQELVEKDVVDTTSWFTPEWNQSLADGTLISWNTGTWGPAEVMGIAPDTAGLWKAAPLPTWDDPSSPVGFIGGSSTIVTSSTEHPAEAVKFLEWLNASEEGTAALASIASAYPAATAGRADLIDAAPPELMSGQPDFYTLADTISSNTADVTWGPNVQFVFDTFGDRMKAAESSGGSFVGVLEQVQEAAVADLRKTGFEVK